MMPANTIANPMANAKWMNIPKNMAKTKQMKVEAKRNLTKLESYLAFFYLEFFNSIFILIMVSAISSMFRG
jgi:hypothetical protein